MKNLIILVMLIMSISLSANAQCNSDSLQAVLDQKIVEYNSVKKTLDSLNNVLNPMIQSYNKINDEKVAIAKEIEILSRVYILNFEVNGIRTSIDSKKVNNIIFSYESGQILISSSETINEVSIFDYQGRKLLTNTTNNKQAVIPLPVLGSSSLYIVMITLQNGQKISKKIIYSIN